MREKHIQLQEIGWNRAWEEQRESKGLPGYPARVIAEFQGLYRVMTAQATLLARVSGKMMHEATGRADFPAVGDWVILDRETEEQGEGVIHAVLERKSAFVRKVAGAQTEEQIVAANADVVMVCMALDHDFNRNRLERYMLLAWNSGAMPLVVLTKADQAGELAEERISEAERAAVGAEVIAVSSVTGEGLHAVRERVGTGVTAVFLGSSGIGKSTLINRLLGEEKQDTQGVRKGDGKGRHTTTHRELFLVPGGGIVIDTPGMRELQLLEGEGLKEAFADIAELADGCRFGDCTHEAEPGCAVKQAIREGTLPESRLEHYRKLEREAAYAERKVSERAAREYKTQMKQLHKQMRPKHR
ncbi:ribosome small subunit-dependent GTPase A [Paenibacillus silviterrae]|uniref:ribosome small subunit-dependent GTPase A n=1 Tax=Paenibacillus silviterrae TaxID=3242194 RepID=UPI002542EE61|nr:ribosome small subunit-dependent GTPase A [Paenibacillus chinjuensis]